MPERRRSRAGRTAGVAAALGLALLAATPRPTGADGIAFRRVEDAFVGAPGHWSRAFDAIAADGDGDGDADLLLSWHHLAELELFENEGGRLRRMLLAEVGLLEAPDVPSLYGGRDLATRLRAEGRGGLFLWHDEDRRGAWNLLWLDPGLRMGGAVARVETSLAFLDVSGAPVRALDARRFELKLDAAELGARARTQRIASELRVRVEGGQPPVFVGDPPQRLPPGELSLWLPDPHGMTWLDFWGERRPDLYVTRGALGGKLAPPASPKRDRAYGGLDRARMRFQALDGAVPADRGSGRRAEWLALGGERLVLAVANRGGPLKLLLPEGETFRDATAELRVDDAVDAFTAGDVDGDGRDDLILLSGGTLGVRLQEANRFGALRSLASLPSLPPAEDLLRVPSLRLADFDADGALDLFALGLGETGASRLLLRRGDVFVDVTPESGIEELVGQRVFALGDWDADGFVDAVSFGEVGGFLWHNQQGRHFKLSALPVDLAPGLVTALVALDVNGDGRSDLVAAGRRRHLLRNVTPVAREPIAVDLVADRSPIGALVRCLDADGRGAVHRLGSAHGTALSQGVLPILCGGPGGAPVRVEVRWPGRTEFARHPAPGSGGRVRIER